MTSTPTNYLQGYVATQIAALDAADVAALIAEPPKGKALQVSAQKIHEMVTGPHGTPETKMAWGLLLAKAASVPKKPGWPSTWALPISQMIFDLPAPEEPARADGQRLEAVA